jgi:hypothetical protein
MVANLLELAKGTPATLSTLPPLASGNGLQEPTQQNAPTAVSIEEDIRQERLEKEAKRLKRAEKTHRYPHNPSECPRCQAAIAERTASRSRGSADASTQMDNIAGGHGNTKIPLRPEGAAADLFRKGRDEWARYMGIAPASGPPTASPPPGIDGALRPKSMGKKLKRARRDELSHRDSTSSGGGASEPTTGCGFCISGCLLCAPQSFGPHYNPEEHQQKRLERKTERRRATNGARRQFRANLAERKRCKD